MIYTRDSIRNIPQTPGVYIYRDSENKILYVGKAINLKKRVLQYFTGSKDQSEKTSIMVSQIKEIETISVESEFEALLLESKLIKKYLPKYNVIWKDDKHYLYLKITTEDFPKLILTRKDSEKDGIYFGPYPSASTLRDILRIVRKIFPYCVQNRNIKKKCFYTHIGLCDPCPGHIITLKGCEYRKSRHKYKQNIRNIIRIFEGNHKILEKNLTKQMKSLSDMQEFETASKIRDKIKNLSYLVKNYHQVDSYIENPEYIKDKYISESTELSSILHSHGHELRKITVIECFDISNISGKFAVGSMVCFRNGIPDKSMYRRFKIRTIKGPNDFLMMREVFQRRILHREWIYPDLWLLDGGKPQLIPILALLKETRINIPVVGLAKEYEEIVIPVNGNFTNIRFHASSNALNLLQRARDEAHRFAHDYHIKIRTRRTLDLFEESRHL